MIQMINVSSKIGDKKVLQSVNLSVKRGESWVLFGADDAGKTTLLHLLMGYNISYQGYLALLGSRPNWLTAEQREKLRYVPDDVLWEKGITGREFLQRAAGVTTRYSLDVEEQLCEYFEVPTDREVRKISHQDNKLLQLVAALAAVPELLILDEPMNFLEPDIWKKVLNCIGGFRRKGLTVLITAESYEALMGQSDHYAYLREGCLMTGAVQKDTGHARRVTAIRQGGGTQIGVYKGDTVQLGNLLTKSAFQDWTIEKLTLQEELDIAYEAKK